MIHSEVGKSIGLELLVLGSMYFASCSKSFQGSILSSNCGGTIILMEIFNYRGHFVIGSNNLYGIKLDNHKLQPVFGCLQHGEHLPIMVVHSEVRHHAPVLFLHSVVSGSQHRVLVYNGE